MSPNGTASTTICVLSATNFNAWNFRFVKLLQQKKIYYLVAEKLDEAHLKKNFSEDNELAITLLLERINDSDTQKIMNCQNFSEMWKILVNHYSPNTSANRMLYLRELLLPKQQFTTLESFLEKQDSLINSLTYCSNGSGTATFSVEELASLSLLWNLPEEFSTISTALQTMDELPSRTNLISKLRIESLRIEENIKSEYSANLASKNGICGNKVNGKICRGKHRPENCWMKYPEKAPICEICTGKHFTNNHSKFSNTTASHYSVCFPLSKNRFSKNTSNSWIFDSGASDHFCNDINLMKNLQTASAWVNTANGDMKVSKIGSVNLPGNSFSLQNTLYCEDLKQNLISVSKLTDMGCTVTFNQNECFATKKEKILLSGKRKFNFWELDSNNCSFLVGNPTTEVSSKSDLLTWHRRLGHLNPKSVLELEKKNLVKGISIIGEKADLECETCLLSKQTRTPFPKNIANRASRCGELIHSDIWGPAPVETNKGFRYFASFVDDFSRCTTVYLLKRKSDYATMFEKFCKLIKNKFNRPITIIHSDNGGEYKSRFIKNFCEENGIEQKFTVAGNPEMNGVAERMNRTLIEMVRCMLQDSTLQKRYWGEALLYATYTRNHCPTVAVSEKVPIELWNGTKPFISHLQPFGSICFAKIGKHEKLSKLDEKSRKCIFLGVENETEGYRLLLFGSDRVIISRDVKFVSRRDTHLGENNLFLNDATSEKSDSTTNLVPDFFSTEVQKNQIFSSQNKEVDPNDVFPPETTLTSNKLNLSALPPISALEKITIDEINSDSDPEPIFPPENIFQDSPVPPPNQTLPDVLTENSPISTRNSNLQNSNFLEENDLSPLPEINFGKTRTRQEFWGIHP